jgi:mannose-6-phosphate isomerase-like protein (cupin superfamily)
MEKKKVSIEKVGEDKRGALWAVMENGVERAALIYTRAGFLRAGHSHDKSEFHILISGEVEEKTTVGRSHLKNPGDMHENPPNVPHLFKAIKDSLVLELKPANRKTVEYERWRKLVIKKMNG